MAGFFVLRNRQSLEKLPAVRPDKTYVRRAFMKSASRMKQWLLLLLCVVMTAGGMVQAAAAAEPTKKCTNLINEGVEYFSNISVLGSDVTKWRQNLDVYAILQNDATKTPVGSVVGMDIEVTNDDTRYSCTINWKGADAKTKMSCNVEQHFRLYKTCRCSRYIY